MQHYTDPTPERGKAPAPCVTKLVNWIDEQLNGPGHETGHQSWLSDIADTLERQRAELDSISVWKRAVVDRNADAIEATAEGHSTRDEHAVRLHGVAAFNHLRFGHECLQQQVDAHVSANRRLSAEIEALTALVRRSKDALARWNSHVDFELMCDIDDTLRARLAATGESDAAE